MWVTLLVKGILIGLLASIPLGPIGVLCIQRTLSKSHKSGFISGLGAATTDIFFAAIALFSLSVVMSFIEHHMMLIKLIGGVCVVGVGIMIFTTNPVVQIRRNRAGVSNLWQDYISMFVFTAANPAFILIFVALFATFGIDSSIGLIDGLVMILGVGAGGALWWFCLTSLVSMFRNRFRPRHLLWINRISGAVIIILGVAALFTLLPRFSIPVNNVLKQ